MLVCLTRSVFPKRTCSSIKQASSNRKKLMNPRLYHEILKITSSNPISNSVSQKKKQVTVDIRMPTKQLNRSLQIETQHEHMFNYFTSGLRTRNSGHTWAPSEEHSQQALGMQSCDIHSVHCWHSLRRRDRRACRKDNEI